MRSVSKAEQNRRWEKIGASFLAIAIVLVLVFGLLPQNALAATTADADTTANYTESLGDNDSTQYAGRVWTDKTVYTEGEKFEGEGVTIEHDSDFLVAYSALATSMSVSGQSQAPLDVVFVIDLSGSMSNENSGMDNRKSRIANTVAAVNSAIDSLMAMNENTRVGVVGFNKGAETLLPLDHYSKDGTNNYFSLSTESPTNLKWWPVTLYTHAKASNGNIINSSTSVSGGTNTQYGMYQGMNLLATADSTTVTVAGQTMQRVPSVVLLSDGAETYSSRSESWWAPGPQSQGSGSNAYAGNGMLLMMTASYMKDKINSHYNVTNPIYAAKVYTIGMGIADLTNNEKNLANISLNPEEHWNDTNTMAATIRSAWETYSTGGSPSVQVDQNQRYNVTHPASNDLKAINNYVDKYYDANDANSVVNVFKDIVNSISLDAPMVPTKIQDDPTQDGYITYTDPIGEYMEVKDLKAIVYGGKVFDNPTQGKDAQGNITYTFNGEIDSPVYGSQNLNEIKITLKEDSRGNNNQTLEIKIPAAAIPLRVNEIALDSNGKVKSNTSNNASPIRVLYTVGMQEGVLDEKDCITSTVTQDYINAHTSADDGTVAFYSNYYDGTKKVNEKTAGNATVEFTPAPTNPYYFIQEDTPLYLDDLCSEPASSSQSIDENTTYYFKTQYYKDSDLVTEVIALEGSTLSENVLTKADEQWNIKAGSPRLDHIGAFSQDKTANSTNTAELVYAQDSSDPQDVHFIGYLGNNGVRSIKASGNLEISKTVTEDAGVTAPDQEFTFKIALTDGTNALTGSYDYAVTDQNGKAVEDENGELVNGTISNDGTIKLKAGQKAVIKNLPIGTKYTVTEENAAGFTLTSKTGDTGTITAGETKTAAFTNKYDPKPVTLTKEDGTDIHGTKTLNGRDMKDGEVFDFTLTAADDVTKNAIEEKTVIVDGSGDRVQVTGAADGTAADFNFGNITFTKAGTYTFNVAETKGDQASIDYDSHTCTVTVQVTDEDKDGQLEANVTYNNGTGAEDNDKAVFVNTYSTSGDLDGSTNLKVTKDLQGRDWFETDEFQFQLKAADELTEKAVEDGSVTLPEKTEISITGKDQTKEKAFGNITFTKPGTYNFKVSEVKGTIAGITYDTHTANIEVNVTDNGGGSLSTATAQTITGSMTFKNTYTPESVTLSGEAGLHGIKTMSGRDLKDTDLFEFTISKADGSAENTPMPAETTVKNAADGSIQFGPITYTEAGTYKYVIRETGGSAAGVANDKEAVYATVTVTRDSTTGKLVPAVTYEKDGKAIDQIRFTNTYNAQPGDQNIGFTAKKTVTASDGNSYTMKGGEFSFTITPAANNPSSDPVKAKTVHNDARGAVVFASDVKYTEAGTYSYTVKEVQTGAGGVIYDNAVYEIQVVVTDNQETGKLETKISITKDGKEVKDISFNNRYNPEKTSAVIGGSKVLTGKDGMEAGDFTFKLSAVGGAPLPASTTAENTAAGIFQFGSIAYTKPGTYEYTVSEVNSGKTGYTYDSKVYTVKVTVTDTGGKLAAAVDGTKDLVFRNSYRPNPVILSGNTALKGTKKLTGRSMNKGEFTFQLLNENGAVEDTAKNDENGAFSFDDITFDAAGTYYYTIKEKNTGAGGVTYDAAVYTAKVTVTDNKGNLEAVTEYLTSEGKAVTAPAFANVYKADSTAIQLGAAKKLEGREMKDGEFTFQLKDDSGNVVAKAKNDNNGVISFKELSLDKAGTYKYTLSEAAGNDKHIAYDDTVYNVTVTVTDEGKGYLTAKIDYNGKAPVFTNTYHENPAAVKTGDTWRLLPLMLLLTAALIVMAAAGMGGLRRRHR